MIRLKDDRPNLTRRGVTASRVGHMRVVVPFLVLLCLGLMLLSRLDHSALAAARWKIAEWMSPVLQAAMVPLEPVRHVGRKIAEQVDMQEEFQRLQSENQKLASWEWRALELERKIATLEALSKVVPDQKINFVTGRVIADSSGAFVRSVMINAGAEQNVKSGYPVVSADGLVGRVVETGRSSSRVLLSIDLNSRIPVLVGTGGVRGVLAGDNSAEPRLLYLPPDARVSPGDDVETSGTGGLFPRGLRIGKVTGDPASPRVKLRTNLDKIEYVSVLFYDNPALEIMGEAIPAQTRAQRPDTGTPAGTDKR